MFRMVRRRDPIERNSWHGFGQPKPKLPAYLHPSKRLRNLDEFERPEGPAPRLLDDDEVTLRGVMRETLQWLLIFFIAGVIALSAWRWLFGSSRCAEIIAGFKIGWC
jgi:hypothetical protein